MDFMERSHEIITSWSQRVDRCAKEQSFEFPSMYVYKSRDCKINSVFNFI